MRRKSPYDYCVLATKANLIWLGPIVTSSTTKTQWQCNLGHVWETTYENIRSGCGCPYCYKENIRSYLNHYTEEKYHELAHSKGFRWVGEVVETTQALTSWECDCGYQWQAKYNDIRQGKGNGGRGCPQCTKSRRKITIDDYIILAAECDIEWIGKELPKSVTTKTEWKCKKGHIWSAVYTSIKRGTRCPKCHGYINGYAVSKPQIAINELVNGSINFRVARYSIDVAIFRNGQKIALEYDSWYWHLNKIDHDAKRDLYLFAHGWKILRVKSDARWPSLACINEAIDYLMNGNTYTEIILPDWRCEK